MKSLIIAEKSSLAKNIVEAIKFLGEQVSAQKKLSGIVFESESYVVVAARGHLYQLKDIEDYTGIRAWEDLALPYFPKQFGWKQVSDAKDYIKIIHDQLLREDVDTIVNAGDAGREGEYLIREILFNLGNTKKVKRLWMPSQVPESIAESLKCMKDDSEYDGLFKEALARAISDWCYGMNYTRFATIKNGGSLLRVGRVISTIVRIIKDRDDEIKSFVPELYYTVESNTTIEGKELHLEYDMDFEKSELNEANILVQALNQMPGIVRDITAKDVTVRSPKLFSLSKLQNYMSNEHNWSASKTLDELEELYLNKYVTYPRTNTEFLPVGEKEKVERIIGRFKQNGYDVIAKPEDKIFDDSKIEDHGAIIPEINFPKDDSLNEDKLLLYNAIKNRFLAYFCKEPRIVSEIEIKVRFENIDDIIVKGHTVKSVGWAKFDPYKVISDVELPNLKIGDKVKACFKIIEHQTSAKKYFTVETLNNYLENPLKKLKGQSDEAVDEAYKNMLDGCNIGTPATLSSIISKAISDELIELKGKNYRILPKGIFLCDTLDQLGMTMNIDSTVELNRHLKLISLGKYPVNQFIEDVKKIIEDTINNARQIELESFEKEVVGICPRCGDKVVELRKTYNCNNRNCKFVLFKDDLFWIDKHKRLSKTMVQAFLNRKKVHLKNVYSKAKNLYYDADFIMLDDGIRTSFKISNKNSK